MLRQREIFWFWLPLFASWMLMTAEGPIISAAINRLPNEVIMLAAQGIVISLSVTIQSPIINLLATSTAMVKDRASYLLVRRFTIHWLILLTAVSVLVAFTPLFDVVVLQWLGTPAEIAQWVQPGLQIMVFWSAAIGWRRFNQGVLISFGQTRQVAIGTAVRLTTTVLLLLLLIAVTSWPGAIIGITALMSAVFIESLYITLAVRPLLRQQLAVDSPVADGEALTYSTLFWFHLPLAGTAVLILLAQPLVTFSLARLDNPTESLAAWPILFNIMLMARAPSLALPEVIIAFSKKGLGTFYPLRRFTFILVFFSVVGLALFTLTPFSDFYHFTLQDMEREVGLLAQSGLIIFLLFPAVAVLAAWLRGLLINARETKAINWGMGINLVVTAVVLGIGLLNRYPGLPTAAAALNLAAVAELFYLAWRTQRILPSDLSLLHLQKPIGRLAVGD